VLIGLLSTGGSPGVSTLAAVMGAAWPDPVVVIDADPAGGDLLAGAGGVVEASRDRGLLELVRLGRQDDLRVVLDSQIVTLPTGVPLVAGLGHPGQAGGVNWSELADGLRAVTHRDVLVDLGRWSMNYPAAPLLRACDVLVLVVRTQLRGLRRAERTLPLIREDVDRHNPGVGAMGLVVVDDNGPYAVADIARRLGVPALGEVAFDPRSAAVFSDAAAPSRGHDRSPLLRSVPGVVRSVGQLAQQQRALGTRRTLLREQHHADATVVIAAPGAPAPPPVGTTPAARHATAAGLREMPRRQRRLNAVRPDGGGQ
jgi:hypothetical protein